MSNARGALATISSFALPFRSCYVERCSLNDFDLNLFFYVCPTIDLFIPIIALRNCLFAFGTRIQTYFIQLITSFLTWEGFFFQFAFYRFVFWSECMQSHTQEFQVIITLKLNCFSVDAGMTYLSVCFHNILRCIWLSGKQREKSVFYCERTSSGDRRSPTKHLHTFRHQMAYKCCFLEKNIVFFSLS